MVMSESESKSQKVVEEEEAPTMAPTTMMTMTTLWQSFWPWLEKNLILLATTIETNDGKLDAATAGKSEQLDSNSSSCTRLVWHAFLSQTGGAIPILLVLFAILHSSLYALGLPVSYFIYAVWQSPRVRVGYWDFLVGYILCTIVLRFLVQLPLFCFSFTSTGTDLGLMVQPYCPSLDNITGVQAKVEAEAQTVTNLHLFFFD